MGMGGDLAAQWLNDFITNGGGDPLADPDRPLQSPVRARRRGCSAGQGRRRCVGHVGRLGRSVVLHRHEEGYDPDRTAVSRSTCPTPLRALAKMAELPLGLCRSGSARTYGGYPAATCRPWRAIPSSTPPSRRPAPRAPTQYLSAQPAITAQAAAGKVINIPGCPTNPFWFVLTVIGVMIDLQAVLGRGGGIGVLSGLTPNPAALDGARAAVSRWSTRSRSTARTARATSTSPRASTPRKPGDTGCLQKIGCKGPYTRSLCGAHGWNNMQPQNGASQTFARLQGRQPLHRRPGIPAWAAPSRAILTASCPS